MLVCGRFVVAIEPADLVTLFDVDIVGDDLPSPSWNVAPTDPVPLIVDSLPRGGDEWTEPDRRIAAARWALVPGWSKGPADGPPLFNARIETVTTKPSFREALVKRRGAIPANGYYEWSTVDGEKTPQYIALPEGELMLFAALYEWWRDPSAAEGAPGRWLLSTTIVTQDSQGPLAPIHDRMPVLLAPELLDDWLDPHTEGDEYLLEAVAAGGVVTAERAEYHPVGPEVGAVRNNGPQLIRPLGV